MSAQNVCGFAVIPVDGTLPASCVPCTLRGFPCCAVQLVKQLDLIVLSSAVGVEVVNLSDMSVQYSFV